MGKRAPRRRRPQRRKASHRPEREHGATEHDDDDELIGRNGHLSNSLAARLRSVMPPVLRWRILASSLSFWAEARALGSVLFAPDTGPFSLRVSARVEIIGRSAAAAAARESGVV